jgi:ribosomal protein L37AE/L43A
MRCTMPVTPGGQCSQDSRYVIIYGCLKLHIRERPMCPVHTDEWSERFSLRKWSCNYCDEKIEDVILLLAQYVVTEEFNI